MSRTQPVVLLVEDDELVSRSVATLLERNQIRVVGATDGKQALELVDRFEFDLVLLDLMLPEVNGFQFLRALRHTEQQEVPVVVITSRTDPVNHFWARRLGAVDARDAAVLAAALGLLVAVAQRTTAAADQRAG